jgi:hypothetical protein
MDAITPRSKLALTVGKAPLVQARGHTLFVDTNVMADLFDRPHKKPSLQVWRSGQ